MAYLYTLRTQDGTPYFLSTCGDDFVLTSAPGAMEHARGPLARVLHTLGGMVDWMVWDEDSRDILNYLNDGKGAI